MIFCGSRSPKIQAGKRANLFGYRYELLHVIHLISNSGEDLQETSALEVTDVPRPPKYETSGIYKESCVFTPVEDVL